MVASGLLAAKVLATPPPARSFKAREQQHYKEPE